MEILLFRIKCILTAPLYLLFLFNNRNGIMSKDLRQWENTLTVIKYNNEFLSFIRMFAALKEYRNLFFYRCGTFSRFFMVFVPCMNNLHFITNREDIAEGLVIQHGYSTVIFAESIGKNCQIWHNVTIGASCVVVKDVPDNCVVCGNPARIIRQDGNKVNIKL